MVFRIGRSPVVVVVGIGCYNAVNRGALLARLSVGVGVYDPYIPRSVKVISETGNGVAKISTVSEKNKAGVCLRHCREHGKARVLCVIISVEEIAPDEGAALVVIPVYHKGSGVRACPHPKLDVVKGEVRVLHSLVRCGTCGHLSKTRRNVGTLMPLYHKNILRRNAYSNRHCGHRQK